MVKISLTDTYIGVITPTATQNEVFTCLQMYHDKKTRGMFDQYIHRFYTCLLFKMDSLPQDVLFLLEISETFFKNLIPRVREILI